MSNKEPNWLIIDVPLTLFRWGRAGVGDGTESSYWAWLPFTVELYMIARESLEAWSSAA
jgi:hypothetical protein